MPTTKRAKPLYQRGEYRLYRREGRANLEIVWYDHERKRERSGSTGTSDLELARLELDRRYLTSTGQRFCDKCGRPFDGEHAPEALSVIADYVTLGKGKAGEKATEGRLRHASRYILQSNPRITVAQIDERWVNGFRKWLAKQPVVSAKGRVLRERSLGAIEGCVLQLAAAINATPGQRAQFTAAQPKTVAASPRYRADVPTLAAMFRYCLHPTGKHIRSEKEREANIGYRSQLLAYLRAAVATWARPEEIMDLTDKQWVAGARVLDLNPPGRRQTRKYRGRVPVPDAFALHLDRMTGSYMQVSTIRAAWDKMRVELGLPADREAGPKLIRRSMATLARKRIGEANWRQGEMMLGHVKASISDIYAIPDPANLGLALAATESIIAEIGELCPGAYHRTFTAPRLVVAL